LVLVVATVLAGLSIAAGGTGFVLGELASIAVEHGPHGGWIGNATAASSGHASVDQDDAWEAGED
jgi:hypothetical protein